jgi:hypothetical protein
MYKGTYLGARLGAVYEDPAGEEEKVSLALPQRESPGLAVKRPSDREKTFGDWPDTIYL